ncbi:hypothetical protein [Pandoraea sp.]|uniref:hypothetical protein n=1 Tax=Pandoraea sp. TaxID=1883445 RepID=UPI0012232D93|nr:hypothetical protein [Pandoraea sp.]TAL53822.1 MAG: hypothetical protein EPN80_14235 [Pandoraea sp.]TAM17075.1 MAG: hypothetical protein EPN65_12405 [Pandoraea sp.]
MSVIQPSGKTSYLLDTNVFNKLLDRVLKSEELPTDGEFVVTHLQIDEINKTSDAERRVGLVLVQTALRVQLVPTETMVFDVSRFDHAKLSDGKVYTELKNSLDALNKSKSNNVHDALIGEVGIVNGYTLITADRDLAKVVVDMGGKVLLIQPQAKPKR